MKHPYEDIDEFADGYAWTVFPIIAILCIWGLIALYLEGPGNSEPANAEPFYATPSRYERDNGAPDLVCKWWGDTDSFNTADHVECMKRTRETDQ